MLFHLPEGLPPGRPAPSGSVGVWVSDDLPQDIERLWMRVLEQQEATGLFPLLCLPDTPAVRAHLAEADAIDLPSVLATDFAEYRRQRLPFWSDPTPEEMPEGIEPWPHDPGPPFESWPGLAPEMPVIPDGPSPAWAAARTAGRLAASQYYEGCRLVLVPASRSADIPAFLEWSEAPVPLLVALLRSWEERFGARVVAVFGAELHVSVARPPRRLCEAELVALEHVLSTADNIVDDPPTPFPWYAEDLLNRTDWRFWWD